MKHLLCGNLQHNTELGTLHKPQSRTRPTPRDLKWKTTITVDTSTSNNKKINMHELGIFELGIVLSVLFLFSFLFFPNSNNQASVKPHWLWYRHCAKLVDLHIHVQGCQPQLYISNEWKAPGGKKF